MAIKVSGTEVVSNARALSNITSIDATTAAAIGAGGVGGGGTVDFTASGSLSNGDLVKLNSNGTVSVIQGGGPGSPTVFESGSIGISNSTFDSNSNKVVIAYADEANSEYGTAVVGTVSGSSISFGTPVVFNTSGTGYINATFDSNSNKVVITYNTGASNSTAIVGTVSGTSISFGTSVMFNSSSAYPVATFDSNSNKIVVAYRDYNNSSYGTARVGTVSGTSISFGTAAVFQADTSNYLSATFDSNSNKVVISYTYYTNNGRAVVGTVSGTSISFGTPTDFIAQNTRYTHSTFDSNSNKVVIVYSDASSSDYGTASIGTVSGTSISFGTPVVFESNDAQEYGVSFDSNVNKVIIAYKDEGNTNTGRVIVGTVSGTSINFGAASTYSNGGKLRIAATFDSNANKTVISYRDQDNSSRGTALTFNPTDINEWVGFASADATNGNTATINVVSSVNEGQSGLTIGSKYYLPDSGTLSTTPQDGREVGRAIAADKIMITQGSVS